MNVKRQRKRAATQLTLGTLIAALEKTPADARVANLRDAHSYRGYYRDLAFERNSGTRSAAELLVECEAAMGKVFEGYKGGNYVMDARTLLWVAHWGDCGEMLMAVHAGGNLETAQDE
jgi:hypothetical protein